MGLLLLAPLPDMEIRRTLRNNYRPVVVRHYSGVVSFCSAIRNHVFLSGRSPVLEPATVELSLAVRFYAAHLMVRSVVFIRRWLPVKLPRSGLYSLAAAAA